VNGEGMASCRHRERRFIRWGELRMCNEPFTTPSRGNFAVVGHVSSQFRPGCDNVQENRHLCRPGRGASPGTGKKRDSEGVILIAMPRHAPAETGIQCSAETCSAWENEDIEKAR